LAIFNQQVAVSQKRREVEPKLLLIIVRSCIIF